MEILGWWAILGNLEIPAALLLFQVFLDNLFKVTGFTRCSYSNEGKTPIP